MGFCKNLTDLLASLFLYYFLKPLLSELRGEFENALFLNSKSFVFLFLAKHYEYKLCFHFPASESCDKMLFRTNTEKPLPKLFVCVSFQYSEEPTQNCLRWRVSMKLLNHTWKIIPAVPTSTATVKIQRNRRSSTWATYFQSSMI